MGNPPMFLHAVNSSTHMCTLAFTPFAFQSVIPHCYTVNSGVDERWHFKLARKSCYTRPLLHFFRYARGLLSGHAVLSIFQMTLNLCGPYRVLTCLAYHNLPLAAMLEIFARHGILTESVNSPNTTSNSTIYNKIDDSVGCYRPLLYFRCRSPDRRLCLALVLRLSAGVNPNWHASQSFGTDDFTLSTPTAITQHLRRFNRCCTYKCYSPVCAL